MRRRKKNVERREKNEESRRKAKPRRPPAKLMILCFFSSKMKLSFKRKPHNKVEKEKEKARR